MTEHLDQFIALTGASRDVAKHYLEASGDTLDTAVDLFFSEHNSASTSSGSVNREQTTSSSRARGDQSAMIKSNG